MELLLQAAETVTESGTAGEITGEAAPLVAFLVAYGWYGLVAAVLGFMLWLGKRKGWFDRKPPSGPTGDGGMLGFTALLLVCVIPLAGCGMVEKLFDQAQIDRDLAAQNLKNWEKFRDHLADPEALSTGWVNTAKLLTTDAIDTAQRLNDKAQPSK